MSRQILTHSRMLSFRQCRKRYWWEYELGIRPQHAAKALRMGTAGHDALNVLKSGREIDAAIMVLGRHYKDMPEGYDQYLWEMERETMETLLVAYAFRWDESAIRVIESEMEFRLPLLNPETSSATSVWDLAGKIDGIVSLEDGRIAVLEHKFISEDIEPQSNYWKRVQMDGQVTLYVAAARRLGFEVETVLYDVIRKPTIQPTQVPLLDEEGLKIVVDADGDRVLTKAGSPRQTADAAKGYTLQTREMAPPEWACKLVEDIGKRPEFYFARVEVVRLDADVAQFESELWDLQRVMRGAQTKGQWYRTVGRDCPYCPYWGPCSSRIDPKDGEVPDGFVKLETVHPELEEVTTW